MTNSHQNTVLKRTICKPLSKLNHSISFFLISAFFLLTFATLSSLFPYTGDDWAWGSNIGITRLENFFENYNGRYLGNLLILSISRNKFLCISIMAISYYFVCWLCYKYTGINKNIVFLFSAILFFIMPKTIFMQSVVWASGFSNYVPSAILSLFYILTVRNITETNTPCYSKYLFIATFLLGFCGALFIENITIFNICLGLAVIIYVAIKFKKVYISHISFLIGGIIGFLLMFSNSAYTSISNGTDTYREIPLNIKDLIIRCASNGYRIFNYLINSNYFICIIISILLFILTISSLKKPQTKRKIFIIFTIATNIFSLLLIVFCKNTFNISPEDAFAFKNMIKLILEVTLDAIYIISIFIIIQMCVPSGKRIKMLLPLCCIPFAVAPLLVVSPIGPRCFFISYLLTMVFAVNLFGYIINDIDSNTLNYKILLSVLGLITILQVIVYMSIFIPIHKYDIKRNEFAKQQSNDNKTEIIVSSLPNEEYLWTSSPVYEPWKTRYKLFHELKDNSDIKVVAPEEFDKYYEIYNKN